ncbi:MAG: TPM domain-containing protein [Bryobacterales bacterium]|nr:TPM domain-containing protein [Bryobacterales bacterium]
MNLPRLFELRIFLLALALVASCASADFSLLQPQGHVSDFANVLNPAHRAELERYCSRVQALTGAEMAMVTVPTLDGEPIEDVANSLFRRWGVGKKGKDEGVLLLMVPRDRRMRLEVGYGLEPILPDGYSGTLLRQLRPLLRSQEYGAAMLEAAHQIGTKIATARNVSLDASIPSRREVRHSVWRDIAPGLLLPAVFLVIVFFVMMGSSGRRGYRRSGLPFFIPMGGWGGSGGGSHSGGGFGGYDSSDSFGGFGGGDSGGGGASSDW